MNIYRVIEDGCVHHILIEEDEDLAIQLAMDHNGENGIESDLDANWKVEEIDRDKELTIDLGGKKIKHTVEEWLHIYDFTPKYLACSEY